MVASSFFRRSLSHAFSLRQSMPIVGRKAAQRMARDPFFRLAFEPAWNCAKSLDPAQACYKIAAP